MYNLAKRQAEFEILTFALPEQMGVVSYSPLGAGILTGKYGVNKRPEQGRIDDEARYKDRYGDDMNYVIADKFSAYASEHGIHLATLAVS